MKIKIQKCGNSQGLRIPNSIIKSLNIKPNDLLEIFQEENRIIITISNNKKISLEKRFKNYNGDNLAKDFSWDSVIGKEIW